MLCARDFFGFSSRPGPPMASAPPTTRFAPRQHGIQELDSFEASWRGALSAFAGLPSDFHLQATISLSRMVPNNRTTPLHWASSFEVRIRFYSRPLHQHLSTGVFFPGDAAL
eukprot:Gb_17518 [translate_table: standard]